MEHYLGIDVEGSFIKYALINEKGVILDNKFKIEIKSLI